MYKYYMSMVPLFPLFFILGKTSLLYKAKLNSTMFANVPPIGANIEEMTPRRGATIAVWDMRGDKLHRHLWRNYYMKTEGRWWMQRNRLP